jgi:hypothetical protein
MTVQPVRILIKLPVGMDLALLQKQIVQKKVIVALVKLLIVLISIAVQNHGLVTAMETVKINSMAVTSPAMIMMAVTVLQRSLVKTRVL